MLDDLHGTGVFPVPLEIQAAILGDSSGKGRKTDLLQKADPSLIAMKRLLGGASRFRSPCILDIPNKIHEAFIGLEPNLLEASRFRLTCILTLEIQLMTPSWDLKDNSEILNGHQDFDMYT